MSNGNDWRNVKMNANKYTQKSLEVIQNAQNLAITNQNSRNRASSYFVFFNRE